MEYRTKKQWEERGMCVIHEDAFISLTSNAIPLYSEDNVYEIPVPTTDIFSEKYQINNKEEGK